MAFIATLATRAAGRDAETLGVVRVAVDPDNTVGEFAIVVRSDLKGAGLGKILMACLLDYCRGRGLAVVRGVALAGNTRMHALASRCGFQLAEGADGTVEMTLVLHSGAAP
jgi:acetyltransferase